MDWFKENFTGKSMVSGPDVPINQSIESSIAGWFILENPSFEMYDLEVMTSETSKWWILGYLHFRKPAYGGFLK